MKLTTKSSEVAYWIFTGSMAALMLAASIPDVLRLSPAIAIFAHLGYPAYLLPFLGVAKTFGAVAVLIPSLRMLKEWAYAGLVFDLTGATYSHLSVGDPSSAWGIPVVALALVIASYFLHRNRLSQKGRPSDETGQAASHSCQLSPSTDASV